MKKHDLLLARVAVVQARCRAIDAEDRYGKGHPRAVNANRRLDEALNLWTRLDARSVA